MKPCSRCSCETVASLGRLFDVRLMYRPTGSLTNAVERSLAMRGMYSAPPTVRTTLGVDDMVSAA